MSENLKINIVTSFYISHNNDRTNELVKVLDKNLHSDYIDKIHLFVDDEKAFIFLKDRYKQLFHSKIKIVEIGKQPLYSDLFNYCNTLKDKICMITNSDIWLYSIGNINILNRI